MALIKYTWKYIWLSCNIKVTSSVSYLKTLHKSIFVMKKSYTALPKVARMHTKGDNLKE